MKICRQCGIKKPLEEFYKHNEMLDGHLNKCKGCVKDRVNKHRENNIEKIRAYDRKRGQTRKRQQKNKEYVAYMKENHPDKWRKMRYDACKKQRAKYRYKYLAKSRLQYAKNTGKIKEKPCLVCGSSKVEAHHPDYSKPLAVVWLCDYHHKEEHKRLRAKERGEG